MASRNDVMKRIYVEFGDLEVVDSTTELRLQPMPCDLVGAVPKDERRCVFTQTAKRMYGATKVIFWKYFAYVDLVGEDGKRRIYKYNIPVATRRLLMGFDRGVPLDVGRAFLLIAIPPSGREGARSRYAATETTRRMKKRPHYTPRSPMRIDLSVRNGQHHYRFAAE